MQEKFFNIRENFRNEKKEGEIYGRKGAKTAQKEDAAYTASFVSCYYDLLRSWKPSLRSAPTAA